MAARPGLLYLDTSALVKLVQREPETEALLAELGHWPALATSVIGEVELRRVVRRAGLSPHQAEGVLAQVNLVAFDDVVRERAPLVGDPLLRTLDAIHLATALSLAGDLGGFACYDARLAAAARGEAVTVVAPL
jgi:predicted nucleic acid-binding protein